MGAQTVWEAVTDPRFLVNVNKGKQPEPAAEEAEEPPAPPPEDPVDAAFALLEHADVTAAVAGGALAEDFVTVCAALSIATPHPAITKALESCTSSGVFSLRGWKCDTPSLCALLAVLRGHDGKVTAVRFWGCGMEPTTLAPRPPPHVSPSAVCTSPQPLGRRQSRPISAPRVRRRS